MKLTNEQILKACDYFQKHTKNLLASDLQLITESVCNAVMSNLHQVNPGFQISDKFLWNSVLVVNEKVAPYLNSELQKNWKIIQSFLYACVGQDVEKHYAHLSAIQDELNEFSKKHNLKTKFQLKTLYSGILDAHFDKPHNQLIYGEESGWGEHGSVSISQPTTYANLWFAAEHLYNHSKDAQNKVITNFISTKDGLVVIFDIEN